MIKTGFQIVSLVTGFSLKPWCIVYYPCFDDLYTTESGADSAVVTSGIVARPQMLHQLLDGNRTSTHNRHKLHKWLSSLVWWFTSTCGRRNHSFGVGPNILLKYLFRGGTYFTGVQISRASTTRDTVSNLSIIANPHPPKLSA